MSHSAEFELMVTHTQIHVFDSSLEVGFNDWTKQHFSQGFAWRPGSVAFRTLYEGGPHLVKFNIASDDNAALGVRVIDVPFRIPPDGRIEVATVPDGQQLEAPPGLYQLRFECFAVSSEDEVPIISLRFVPNLEPRFAVVLADLDLDPGPQLILTAAPVHL